MLALRSLVFLGAFLLFALEPMVGRLLLPIGGGSYHVWATALMFFQGMLLVGYLYCHLIAPRLGRWHVLVAALPLLLLPVGVEATPDHEAPIATLLLALTLHVALPFGVLATTAVLAQQWLAGSDGGRSNPYPLYGVSNAGALLGLLAYPLIVEPLVGLGMQSVLWSAGYVGYFALVCWTAWRYRPTRAPEAESPERGGGAAAGARPGGIARWPLWLVLAAAPSALLIGTTNLIVMDLGSFPLVWVLPLGLYLLSFVLVFETRSRCPRLVRRFWFDIALVGAFLYVSTSGADRGWVIGFHLAALFVVCMAAHDALYRSRPEARALTGFYLAVAGGGFLGGTFASLLAPAVFDRLDEYPVALGLAALGLAIARRGDLRCLLRRESWPTLAGSAALVVLVAVRLASADFEDGRESALHESRNHYGLHRVVEHGALQVRALYSGTTEHGVQVQAPRYRDRPTSYYARESPLGDVLGVRAHRRRLGVVGLGVGTVAAYLEAGDQATFFEIDPAVAAIANDYFTYLADCAGETAIVIGDARVRMDARRPGPDERFDTLVLDAFQSDSIPTHLLTQEAVEVYLRQVADDGLLLFHISSRYYDLHPVLAAVGRRLGLAGAFKGRDAPLALFESPSSWFVLTRSPAALEPLLQMGWTRCDDATFPPDREPWTDDHADLLAALLWSSLR